MKPEKKPVRGAIRTSRRSVGSSGTKARPARASGRAQPEETESKPSKTRAARPKSERAVSARKSSAKVKSKSSARVTRAKGTARSPAPTKPAKAARSRTSKVVAPRAKTPTKKPAASAKVPKVVIPAPQVAGLRKSRSREREAIKSAKVLVESERVIAAAARKSQAEKARLPKVVVKAAPVRRRKAAPATLPASEPATSARPSVVIPTPVSRSAAKRSVVKLPPELLEGDEPAAPRPGGPGQRYALGATPPPHGGAEPGDLPESYGTNRLLLTARDPHWLYATWDILPAQQRRYNALSRDRHLIVRVHVESLSGPREAEAHVHPESKFWFLHVGRGGTKFLAQLGFYTRTGEWITVATSRPTMTPPDTLAAAEVPTFAAIPSEVPFAELIEAVKSELRAEAGRGISEAQPTSQRASRPPPAAGRQTSMAMPLIEAIRELRESGHSALPPVELFTGTAPLTPAQEQALAKVVSMDDVRRVWVGSVEITELIRRRMAHDLASIAALPVPSGEAAEGRIPSGAISSPAHVAHLAGRQFWFNVNAELIIYGATEPDAAVTIAGRRVSLRKDGSFSFRFALPDGQYDLPATAVSADQTEARHADLKFRRQTEYVGDVGAHPQSTDLKPPQADAID
jgi:uncharacterized protein